MRLNGIHGLYLSYLSNSLKQNVLSKKYWGKVYKNMDRLENKDPLLDVEITKDDYNAKVAVYTRDFMITHFKDDLLKVYQKLNADCKAGKNLHYTFEMEIPEHFDNEVTKRLISNYFRNQKFTVIVDSKKDQFKHVEVTLT